MRHRLGHMELCRMLRDATPGPLDAQEIAEVMDALAWHPYVALDLRASATALALVGRADPGLGAVIRRLAEDALVLGDGDEISAARAAAVGYALQEILAGVSPDQLTELSPGWEIAMLARSWLARGIGDPDRLREVITEMADEFPAGKAA